jgi:hypothetical protein
VSNNVKTPVPNQAVPNNALLKAGTTSSSAKQDGPNRSFSTSVLLGKVPVIIFLPGMQEKRTVQNVVKKKHTLLPQHRPPLRRDKPVRVSLPDQQPRYIFPSTERSFIFIPRALRPNQQGFGRGRGRSSFNASRRTSVYGGSAYTPSVGMSRRSSLGGIIIGEGVRSPGGSTLSLPPGYMPEAGKPVVRFPPPVQPTATMQVQARNPVNGPFLGPAPIHGTSQVSEMKENMPSALTMHQPRPQKTVSVADIESPSGFHFNPPQQQQEQPFHQQMPPPTSTQIYPDDGTAYNAHARRLSHVSHPSGTPLSHIPERAIYAQPFQPFPMPQQQQGYFPSPYAPGAAFYPAMQPEMTPYGSAMGPPTMAPAFIPGSHAPQYMVPAAPMPAPVPTDASASVGTVAHESNGMVYYYDSAQMPPNTGAPYSAPFVGPPVGGVVGMGGMMTPPNHFFYPPPNSGVYYTGP